MTKLVKLIIFFIIIIIILIIVILSIFHFNEGEIVYEIDEIGSEEELHSIDSSIQLETVRDNYYAVKSCIEKFYTYYSAIYDSQDTYNEFDEETSLEIEQENKQAVYDMLDVDYIDYKDINKSNISEKLQRLNYSIVNINQMYVSRKNPNMYVYIINGTLREVKSAKISDFKIMIKLDALHRTFKVFLDDYIDDKFSNIELNNEIDIEVQDSIEKNDSNIYDYRIIDDETYIKDLFAKYKDEILFDSENAYYHLNEDYRTKRFGTLDNFQSYLKENINKNVIMKLEKFQINNYDDYIEYVCLDQNGNYYIFNEDSIMNYNLILDTYTIDLPSFIEKYDQGDEQKKVGMNIEKVINAINAKDYKYVYNKLDKTFRNNNFDSLDYFIEYIQNNFYVENEIEYKKFTDVGGVYTYNLIIKDINELENNKNITIVIKLLDNRDFVMSFNSEE